MMTLANLDRRPTHPGEILRVDYLNDLNITIKEFAESLGVTRQAMSNLVNEKSDVSPEMALRLSKALGTSPEVWLSLQEKVDLWEARKRVRLDDIKPLDLVALQKQQTV